MSPSSLPRPARRLAPLLLAALLAAPGLPAEEPARDDLTLHRILEAEDFRQTDRMAADLDVADPTHRRRVLLALGRIGAPADAPRLIAATRDADAATRAVAAFALGEMMDHATVADYGQEPSPEAVAAATALLADPDDDVAGAAAEALGKMKTAPAAAAIAARLPDPTAPAAGPAARRLGELGLVALLRGGDAAVALPAAVRFAASPEPTWRAHAAVVLGRLGDAAAAGPLRALLADPDPDVRVLAAGGAARLKDAEALGALFDLAGAPEPRVRGAALRALGELDAPEALAFLEEKVLAAAPGLAADPATPAPDGVAANELIVAIEAVGARSGREEVAAALDPLRLRLDGVGARARVAHARVLARRGEPDRFFVFPAGFRSPDIPSTLALIQALGHLPTPDAHEMLDQLLTARGAKKDLRDRLALLRPHVLDAIVAARHPQAADRLFAALESSDIPTRARAIALLPQLPAPEVEAADAAIERTVTPTISDPVLRRLLAALDRAMTDGPGDARLAAYEALAPYAGQPPVRRALREAVAGDRFRTGQFRAAAALGEAATIDWPKVLKRATLTIDRLGGPGDPRSRTLEALLARAGGRTFAIVEVAGRGRFAAELYGDEALVTAEHFAHLAGRGFFDGLSFHRVVPGFVIQGGDPRHDMEGGPGYEIPCEINRRAFRRGTLGMALSGKDTGGSQFFVCLAPQPHLDGGYTAFGEAILATAHVPDGAEFEGVVGADEVLDAVTPYDRITSVRIVRHPAPR